ncbi:MAG: polysaccharide deacetylase family protein [Desulfuromonadales bacterium]
MKIAVTVDVENDLGFLDTHTGIDEGLPAIVRILEKYGVKGTFFVSGDSLPYLQKQGFLKDIEAAGHEIGSHGQRHTDYRQWEYCKIVSEVKQSKRALEDVLQKEIVGYRAPQFQMSAKYFRAIWECGFLYDSSLPDPKGISAARLLRKVHIDEELLALILQSDMKEFAIDSLPILKVPHGLLWINIVTLTAYKRLFSFLHKDFMMFYLHPFDVIRDKNRINLDIKRKLFYLKNGNNTESLLDNLISFWISKDVNFVRLGDTNNL